ncbi:enoyl-CoA hydratase/isomerase family protein [Oceanobacillus halotolerans]|uniref:enoyl-CoA hydratase/isomerase family protein n=1 Tax=Oceanobacillus halotolerans TaxID=2663380 RepID=UPI0013DB8645|nr:enoyl-CoA hydratase-related protein [Oceanobacillus halotolerans]
MKVTISRFDTDGKITLQESGGIAIVTMHRPRLKNAMTNSMWRELADVSKRIVKNPKNRVVILKGGKDQFTAGSDIKQFDQLSIEDANSAFDDMEKAIASFEKLPLPTIALINGPAMGAGFVLALACDLRIGTPDARMGIPVGRLGITLSQAFVNRIMSFVGKSRTLDLVYTGRIIHGDEAVNLGLLNYMAPDKEELIPYTLKIAERIKEQSPASLLAVKRSAAFSSPSVSIPWQTGVDTSVDPYDFPEGVRSFVEKRKPSFKRRR